MNKVAPSLAVLLLLTGCLDYSDGVKAGTVTQFSHKGYFCKTWEGQLLMGGLRKETQRTSDGKSTFDTMVANTMDFTVEDPALVPVIQAALESGDRVQLAYHQEVATFCRSDSGSRFITGVAK